MFGKGTLPVPSAFNSNNKMTYNEGSKELSESPLALGNRS